MKFAKWLGGSIVVIGAVLGTYLASPAVWDAARSKGDQPGGVVKTWGMVQ